MARKPSRAETGRIVTRSADRLGDALLLDEDVARAAMEAKFVAEIPAARRIVAGAHRDGLLAALRGGAVDRLGGILVRVTARCAQDVRALLESAADQTLTAITVELEAVERNLGARYDGLASQAVDEVRASAGLRMDPLLDVWTGDMAQSLVWFDDAVMDDWRAAALSDEPAEDVDRRMFSAEPVRLPGQGGMGRWWKPLGMAFGSARAQEFSLVNGIRTAAIRMFNEQGVRIRDGR